MPCLDNDYESGRYKDLLVSGVMKKWLNNEDLYITTDVLKMMTRFYFDEYVCCIFKHPLKQAVYHRGIKLRDLLIPYK